VKPFADHFSQIAASYAVYRPHYPAALFDWLASITPDRERAWDCATGSGQAATALSRQFSHVIATDPSTAQIANAERALNVHYAAMTAERPAIAESAVALVTVAQALHWLDRQAFYAEARRVLAPRGVIAVWTYGPCELGDPSLDAAMRRFHDETVGPYWPAERALVVRGLADVEFPFDELRAPAAPPTRWRGSRRASPGLDVRRRGTPHRVAALDARGTSLTREFVSPSARRSKGKQCHGS
jgi:SAM-dependent methyltransferase